MGDFVRDRFEEIHDILVEDALGEKIGVIKISTSIHLRESWDHLGKGLAEPAGPHNRRIVAETAGHLVYGHRWGLNADDPLPEPLAQIVATLKEQGGLEGVPYTDEGFSAAFSKWAQSVHSMKVTFRSTREGLL